MTENISNDAAFNLSLLDPNSWEEPKELIPVKVVKSRFRWSAPEYNKATSFRQAFPVRGAGYGPEGNSIQQWDFQLERLDAVYVLPDGTTAPVIIYAGCDLEKLDKNNVLKGIMKTRGKEQTVISGWTKAVGSLVPDPSRIEGMMFMVERFREKEIAQGFFAKNVVLPVEALAPTYVYTGDKQRFDAKREATDAGVSGAVSEGTSAGVTKDEAAKLIADFLVEKGIDRASAGVSILGDPDFPGAAKVEPFLTAAATGNLAATLASYNV